MAENYSVKATLSAHDSNFTSTMKNANKSLETLGGKVKSGLSFGILTGIGQQAFNVLTSGAMGLIGEIDSSNAAWKTFDSNMKIIGKDDKYIKKVQGTLQKFAQKTIYSSSDMATTYAQLEAVGVKSADKLVTGFGGLAAAAENPQQAMKTLSQQATQMAAKPSVAWADFKLMLEQTPAGIAAVAKEMGMSTSELVTKVQEGKVKTTDFFNAINKVGNSKAFQGLATEAKTVGQAFDGFKETLANKLLPSFNTLSNIGIKAINKISDALSGINADELNTKLTTFIEKATPYWEQFCSVAKVVGDILGKVVKFFLDHSEAISKAIPYILGAVAAFKGFMFIKSITGSMAGFAKSITSLAGGGLSKVASGLDSVGQSGNTSSASLIGTAKAFLLLSAGVLLISVGFALLAQSAIALANSGGLAIGVMAGLVVGIMALGAGMALLLKFLAPMGAKLMPVATAMLAMGAAVVLVSAGFAILAATAIQLSNAGGLAIGVMVGLVAAVALLAVGAAVLAPALTAGAIGLIAFGAAMLLVGTGALLASAGLLLVSQALPTICTYGLSGALAITALGAALLIFSAGVIAASVSLLAFSVTLTAAALTMTLAAAGALLLTAGFIALGAGGLVASAGVALLAALVPTIAAVLPGAAGGSLALSAALLALGASGLLAGAALVVLSGGALAATITVGAFGAVMLIAGAGALVMSAALKAVNSSMKSISKSAKTTEKSLKSMEKSINVVEKGLKALGDKAKDAINKLINSFNKGKSSAQHAGKGIANALNTGLQSGFVMTASISSNAVKIVSTTLNKGTTAAMLAGANISRGFANGMLSQLRTIERAAARMAAAADKAVKAKAKIHSPSRVAMKDGQYWGQGLANGILDKTKEVWRAAQTLAEMPSLSSPNLNFAYAGEMSGDYEYYRNNQYIIEVPVVVDGKEIAKVTAPYTEEELNKRQRRESRKKGKV